MSLETVATKRISKPPELVSGVVSASNFKDTPGGIPGGLFTMSLSLTTDGTILVEKPSTLKHVSLGSMSV